MIDISYKNFFLFILFFSTALLAQSSDNYWAVQTHFGQFTRPDMDSVSVLMMLDSVKSAGIKFIRDECYWADVETTPGVFNYPSQVDFYIQSAKQRGIDILLILNYNNPLYAAHAGAGIVTDTNRAKFIEYCRRTVARYSPLGVKHYEIWNEPNIPIFWHPTPNAFDYFKLLQNVYPAIKEVDSSAVVIACATSPAEGNPSPFINWLTFISQVYSYGGGNFMDGVSFHLYRVDRGPENWLQTDYLNLKNIVGSKPMWLTEFGYHTSSVWPNLSLQAQAEFVARLYLIGSAINQLNSVFYYDLKNDGTSSNDPEHNFGLMNFDLSPKPAFKAYKTLTSELQGKNILSVSNQSNFFKYIYSNLSDTTYALWNPAASSIKTEIFSSNRLRVTDIFGSTYYVFDKDKIINIKYSSAPTYVTTLTEFPQISQYRILPANDTLIVGQKVNLSLRGITADNKIIFIDSTAVSWSVSNSLGSIDSFGRFTALQTGVCTVRAVLDGNLVEKIFFILASYDQLEIEPFNSLDAFTISYFNMLPATSLSIIDSNYTSPYHSLKVDYSFKLIGIDKHRIYFDCNISLLGEPDSILIDVFNNGNGHVINFQIEDANGSVYSVNTAQSQLLNKFGWTKVKASLRSFGASFSYPAKLKRLTFFAVKTGGVVDSIYSGTVLLDNLRINNGIPLSIKSEDSFFPEGFMLYQNYPNPFNPSTKISWQSPIGSRQTLKVYDILGSEVATLVDEYREAGSYEVEFSARGGQAAGSSQLASGVYYYQLRAIPNGRHAGRFVQTKKMILIK